MDKEQKEKLISFLEIAGILILFAGLSILVQRNLDFFKGFIDYSVLGVVIYFLIVILAIVIAPISSVPLIPLMSGIFGWVFTGVVSIFAWTVGSIIAFYLARRWGVPIISKLVSLKQLQKMEKKIPEENAFWTVVLLRMVIPVDILSYALGLFSQIKFSRFVLATFIGVIPVTFILAYAGSVSFKIQMIIFGILFLIIFIVLWIRESLAEKKLKG